MFMRLLLSKIAQLFFPNKVDYIPRHGLPLVVPMGAGKGSMLPPVFEILNDFPIVVIISGVGSRDYNDLEEIWTVIKNEHLFCFFLFETIVEATLFSKFLCQCYSTGYTVYPGVYQIKIRVYSFDQGSF